MIRSLTAYVAAATLVSVSPSGRCIASSKSYMLSTFQLHPASATKSFSISSLFTRTPSIAQEADPSASIPTCAQPKGKGKAPTKKRLARQQAPPVAGEAIPAKKQRKSGPGSSTETAILSSLLNMKSALNSMNTRIQSLENSTLPSASNPNLPGPSSAVFDAAPAATALADVTPHRTLGTAVPAPVTGSRFLPPAAAIPDSPRNQILAGIFPVAFHYEVNSSPSLSLCICP